MAHTGLALSIILWILLLSACSDGNTPNTDYTPGSPGEMAYNAEAARQDLHAAQTRIAEQVRIERAATAQAQAEDRKRALAATTTAQALQVAQAQFAATQNALTAKSTIDARNFQATQSAISAQQTADAVKAQATATADAQQIAANLEKLSATATAQAMTLAQARARTDEARAQSDAEFFNLVFRLSIVLALLLAFIFGAYAINQILNISLLRRAVIETRHGTMILMTLNGQPSAQPLSTPSIPALMPGEQPGDEFQQSQSKVIDAEAHALGEPYKVVTSKGTYFIPRTPDANETDFRLVLRLLRESMQLNGAQSDTIPPADQLGWSDHTRDRAVKLVADYIKTKQGRKGGTFVGERHKTLIQLYSDVGARRVSLSPAPPNGQPSG